MNINQKILKVLNKIDQIQEAEDYFVGQPYSKTSEFQDGELQGALKVVNFLRGTGSFDEIFEDHDYMIELYTEEGERERKEIERDYINERHPI